MGKGNVLNMFTILNVSLIFQTLVSLIEYAGMGMN